VENDLVTNRISSLIKPPTDYFNPFNISIHGITWENVKDKPEFCDIFPKIMNLIGDRIVIAHYAAFDMSVLRYTLDYYGIPYPEISYGCTRNISKHVWPGLLNYGLSTVAQQLDISFHHHDPDEDALTCAAICMKAGQAIGARSLPDLAQILSVNLGRLHPGSHPPAKSSNDARSSHRPKTITPIPLEPMDGSSPIFGRNFVFTGTLQSMTRAEATAKVLAAGGECSNSVGSKTDFLVMGEQDLRRLGGQEKSGKARRAEDLISNGIDIEVIGERYFLEMLTP
jgi:DNA polymerase-3 subunit epsilon